MPCFWNYEEKRKGTPSSLKEKDMHTIYLKTQLWFYFLKDGLVKGQKNTTFISINISIRSLITSFIYSTLKEKRLKWLRYFGKNKGDTLGSYFFLSGNHHPLNKRHGPIYKWLFLHPFATPPPYPLISLCSLFRRTTSWVLFFFNLERKTFTSFLTACQKSQLLKILSKMELEPKSSVSK